MSEWLRVSRQHPCPICGKPDWCGVAHDESVVCCMRIESDKPSRNGGWIHRLRDSDDLRRPRVRRATVSLERSPDFGELARKCERRVRVHHVERLAQELGVSVASLQRLGIGWDCRAWTFPVRSAAGVVVGIRRRFKGGDKRFVTGSRAGLFVPSGIPAGAPVLIAEGESDCAAALTLGFDAVGRCGCLGGADLLSTYCRGRDVGIVGDGDEPGQRGAQALAGMLTIVCPNVRVVFPPDGLKDIREWLQRGGAHADVQSAIRQAEPQRLKVGAA